MCKSRGYVYNTGVVEEWLLERLDRRLGAKGRPVPDDSSARARLAKELLGRPTWRCNEETAPLDDADVAASGEVEKPRKVSEVGPRVATGGTVIIKYTVGEDGIVRDLGLTTPSPHEDLNTAVLGAASLWRYQPGRLNGCEVGMGLTSTVNVKPTAPAK